MKSTVKIDTFVKISFSILESKDTELMEQYRSFKRSKNIVPYLSGGSGTINDFHFYTQKDAELLKDWLNEHGVQFLESLLE